MNSSALRIAAAVVAVGILIGAWLTVSNLPMFEPATTTSTTRVVPTLPDTVATLAPVTEPQAGTSLGK